MTTLHGKIAAMGREKNEIDYSVVIELDSGYCFSIGRLSPSEAHEIKPSLFERVQITIEPEA